MRKSASNDVFAHASLLLTKNQMSCYNLKMIFSSLILILMSYLNYALEKTLDRDSYLIHANMNSKKDREGFLLECRPIIELSES